MMRERGEKKKKKGKNKKYYFNNIKKVLENLLRSVFR
jgi:hypothetical protein